MRDKRSPRGRARLVLACAFCVITAMTAVYRMYADLLFRGSWKSGGFLSELPGKSRWTLAGRGKGIKGPGESRLLLHVASVHPRFPGENSEVTVRIPLRPNVTLTRFDFGAEPGSPNYVYDDDPRENCECERRVAFSSLLESVQGMFLSLHDPSIVIQLGKPTMKETLKRFTAKDGTENTKTVEEVASWIEFRLPAHQLQGQPDDWACKISLDGGKSWHETGKHVAFDGSRRLYTVTQYAASANPNRTMEVLLTLERNLDNPAIAEFHFLQEDEHPLPPQIVNHPKTIVSRLSSRTTFSDLLRYALRELEGRRILITNMDILFDDSLDLIRTRLNDTWMSTSMVTLAVSDLTEDAKQVVRDDVSYSGNRPPGFLARPLISGSTVYAGWLGNRQLPITDERCNIAHTLGSFDAFVFSTAPPLNRQLWLALPELEFWQGVYGSENRFMYEVHRVTRALWKNYCRSVRAVHMHVFQSPNAHPGDRVNLYGKSLHQFQAEEIP